MYLVIKCLHNMDKALSAARSRGGGEYRLCMFRMGPWVHSTVPGIKQVNYTCRLAITSTKNVKVYLNIIAFAFSNILFLKYHCVDCNNDKYCLFFLYVPDFGNATNFPIFLKCSMIPSRTDHQGFHH